MEQQQTHQQQQQQSAAQYGAPQLQLLQPGSGMQAPQLVGAQPQYQVAAAAALRQQQAQQQHFLQQMQQAQQQAQQAQQPMLLVGRPMAALGGTSASQAMGGSSTLPFSMTLPGGTMLHPQFAGLMAQQQQQQQQLLQQQQQQAAHLAAANHAPMLNAGGGFPQLAGLPSGLTFQPESGIPLIRGHPLTVATSAPSLQPNAGAGAGQRAGAHLSLGGRPSPSPGMLKLDSGEDRPSSSHSANTSAGGLGSDGSPHVGGGSAGTPPGSAGSNKSRYRGVSYDRKKAKWRVQIKVAALGKSGVSVGYFDTEEAAARAYDRAAIGLLGLDNPNLQTNFDMSDYAGETIPTLTGKTREEVKTTLKSERIKQAPRRRFTSRQRTSRYMGVGSSNRKNQWQARILVHGKVTHLGYYETEEEAARVYDRVSIALHGDHAQTNFSAQEYGEGELAPYRGLDREDLQRALGVKPMDKSSRFRGVSKKKGKWEAKVMVNRRWAYRELFDSEEEAARAYDRALWRLKPREARSYVNFKDELPPEAAAAAAVAASAGGNYAGASSDGDPLGSDGGFDDEDVTDEDDFEYEYKPTKGTARSASMRASKRAGSAPNLVRPASTGAATRHFAGGGGGADSGIGGKYMGAPAFVPMAGGGLQLQFNSGSTPAGMVPVGMAHTDEPLLIRVGSEVHYLPPAGPPPSVQTLGKRSGLQRIHSEPQLPVSTRGELLVPGANASDIHDLMNDRDLFKGLAGSGGELPSLADYMQHETPLGRGSGAGSFFEDEDVALANLEFEERPRKMSKSMSLTQLPALEGDAAAAGGGGSGGASPPVPVIKAEDSPSRLGPLGQPIRRVATFTSSLPSFAEGEERGQGDARLHMPSQHSSEEDLVKQLLEPMAPLPSLDNAMHLLG